MSQAVIGTCKEDVAVVRKVLFYRNWSVPCLIGVCVEPSREQV
jgi:hypothetical protein